MSARLLKKALILSILILDIFCCVNCHLHCYVLGNLSRVSCGECVKLEDKSTRLLIFFLKSWNFVSICGQDKSGPWQKFKI